MGRRVSCNLSVLMFPDVDVFVLIADLEEFVEVGQHQFYQLGIEVLTFLLWISASTLSSGRAFL